MAVMLVIWTGMDVHLPPFSACLRFNGSLYLLRSILLRKCCIMLLKNASITLNLLRLLSCPSDSTQAFLTYRRNYWELNVLFPLWKKFAVSCCILILDETDGCTYPGRLYSLLLLTPSRLFIVLFIHFLLESLWTLSHRTLLWEQ